MANMPKFSTYNHRLLKTLYPNTGISGPALACLDNTVIIIIEKIMFGVNKIMLHTNKKTISDREIEGVVRMILPEELAKHAISEGTKAVMKFTKLVEKVQGAPSVSKSTLAGLIFPVTRIQNYMMRLSVVSRKSERASVYLAAVCEYLIAEILEVSQVICNNMKKMRISTRHIMLAIQNDTDQKKFYSDCVFSGGVVQQRKN